MKIFSLTVVWSFFAITLTAQVEIKPDSSTFQSKLTLKNTFEINGMVYPSTDGLDGQVLTTDGQGNLHWQNGSTDFSSFYDYTCSMPIATYQMNADFNSDDGCGILYDSGGENGNYGNNEFSDFTILNNSNAAYTRLILQSLAIEDNRDTLFIDNTAYFTDVNSPDTLIFDAQTNISIRFQSDFVNNDAGFILSWERFIYQGGSSVNSSMLGFFYNAEQLAIGGGVEQNGAWSTVGEQSVLLGYGGSTTGDKGTGIGYTNTVSGNFSSAFGYINEASALNSSALGDRNQATGSGSSAVGYQNDATASLSNAFGFSNEASSDNSSAFGNRNDALGANSTAVGYSNLAQAANDNAIGYDNNATGSNSTAIGVSNTANQNGSSAIGYQNQATGLLSNAYGSDNEATAQTSSAFGRDNTASGQQSSAFGYSNQATAFRSSAFGYSTTSDVYQLMAVGCHNSDPLGSSVSWVETDPVFVIGNGENNTSRSTAVTVLKNGNVGIGTISPDEVLEIDGKIRLGSVENIYDGGSQRIAVNSNFVPETDAQRDLGVDGLRWRSVWSVDGTINTSDRRQKSHIKKLNYGLAEIMQLKPVRFRWKAQKAQEEKLGLIAQDLLAILPEVVKTHDWQPISEAENAPLAQVELKNMGVFYADIIPVLINGIQEQQAEIEALQQQVEALTEMNQRILALEQKLVEEDNTAPVVLDGNKSAAQLFQNHPNPFNTTTTIKYVLPKRFTTAQLVVMDVYGNTLQQFELVEGGTGSLILKTKNLPNGSYQYALVVNGEVLEMKQMILVD